MCEVGDDGRGVVRHRAPDGVGLASMRERAEEIGGRLERRRPRPGRGTTRDAPGCPVDRGGGAPMIRVLVVDDHPLFRDGLAGLLAHGRRRRGASTRSATARRPYAAAAELAPDVVLMDLNLPGLPGLEAIRRIVAAADPAPAVLVLTMVDDDDSVTAALQVGARGYLLKGAVQEEVLAAIRTVAGGGAVFGAGRRRSGCCAAAGAVRRRPHRRARPRCSR